MTIGCENDEVSFLAVVDSFTETLDLKRDFMTLN